MLADLIVLGVLLAGAAAIRAVTGVKMLPRLEIFRRWPSVLSAPWFSLVLLAIAISMSGWLSRIMVYGVDDTLRTAAGGPTEHELEACRTTLRATRRCPYGGEVTGEPPVCSIHGAAKP